jgi:hypothetical protein
MYSLQAEKSLDFAGPGMHRDRRHTPCLDHIMQTNRGSAAAKQDTHRRKNPTKYSQAQKSVSKKKGGEAEAK